MNVYSLENGSTIVNTTLTCYNKCPWCYYKKLVTKKPKHVPLVILIERIRWVATFVDGPEICQAGGEPLTHPDFIAICAQIISMGKIVGLITSGRIDFENEVEVQNLQHALALYQQGLLEMRLSFQPGQNDLFFDHVVAETKKRYKKRREALKKLNRFDPKEFDLATTMVTTRAHVADKEGFLALVNHLQDAGEFSHYTIDDKNFVDHYERLCRHFAEGEESESLTRAVSTKVEDKYLDGWRYWFRTLGETEVTRTKDGKVNLHSAQSICDAMQVTETEVGYRFPSLLVDIDGEVKTASVKCLLRSNGYCNTDIHTTEEDIREATRVEWEKIHRVVFEANRRKAALNCGEDGVEKPCTACPLNDMCGFCHMIRR